MPEPPTKPTRPGPATPRPGLSFWMFSLLVIVGVLLASGVVVLTLGAFGGVLALGAMIFLFAALHYLAWGWWLGAAIRRDVAMEEEEARLRAEAEREFPDRDSE